MSKTLFAIIVCTLTMGFAKSLPAQTDLYLALSSPQRVVDDVKAILDLTTPEEQEQKEVLNDYFDLLLDGIDQSLILKLDVISEPQEARYRIFFPVTQKTRDFRENLKGYDFISRRDRKNPSLYTVAGEYTGFLLFDIPYAILVKQQVDLETIRVGAMNAFSTHEKLNDLPEVDVILSLKNEGGDVEERHAKFGGIEELIKAYVTRREGESAEDFAVREGMANILIDELERVYAEGKSMLTTWSLPAPVENGQFTTLIDPIAETSLAATVNQLKEHPSQFAGIPEREDAILKLRILLPLDELRQKNLSEYSKVMQAAIVKTITDDAEKSEDSKQAFNSASDLFFAMLDESIKSGWLDTVAQVYNNDAGRVSLGVMNAVNGEEARKILELVPKTAEGRAIEFDIDKQGDVSIHKLTFEEGALQSLQGFFGDDVVVYVGTSTNAFWISAGANAVEELKSAITQAEAEPAKPTETHRFVDLKLAVGAWVETVHKARGESGNDKLYNFAKSAFEEGADAITLQLNQKGDVIDGELNIEQGVLRLAGKLIADFSAENLEE
ncbi:hypothetical protein Pla110_31320 [Polystyrenella longa]|uniref:Uncharacterized protein n=1 Tax=Polystyrenella longa TaxID=2528007 RepID=A0A518CQA1_9PLAN|nr:hypothetical protein [Polystyrenella longa]QDU81391.1 hypothetical protein Pla110_31320 [Polystyrenella longa]